MSDLEKTWNETKGENKADSKKVMLAAYHGHAQLVKLLIQHGADPNRVNDRGQTPLAGAVFKGEAEVIEVCYSPWCRHVVSSPCLS